LGRHSTHQQSDFVRSAFMWFLPWLLAAVVGIGALWIGIDAALGGDEASPATEPPGRSAAKADPSASPEDDASETASPAGTPTPSEEPEVDEKPAEKKEKKPAKLISDGVPVQVLNGTSTDAGDRIADRLETLGFEIVAVNPWHTTTETVVYWSQPNDERAAMLLAEKFGWAAEPKPSDLSSEVRLHILVGSDEATP
jgi:LytR cell envelope-related transcriptional attenuator